MRSMVSLTLRSIVGGAASMAVLAAAAPGVAAEQTPDALMRKIMNSYREGLPEKQAMLGQAYFDPALTRLDQENGKLFDGVDVLDADPVCQCQDVGGTYHYTTRREGAGWVATVSRTDTPGTTWKVIWKKIGGRWRIWDVVDETGGIRGLLERHNKCAREKIAHHLSVEPCTDLK
jgi:hypothetical protein